MAEKNQKSETEQLPESPDEGHEVVAELDDEEKEFNPLGLNIHQRMAAIRSEIRYLTKDTVVKVKSRTGGEFSYKGLTTDKILLVLQPKLDKYQVAQHVSTLSIERDADIKMTTIGIEVAFRCATSWADDAGAVHPPLDVEVKSQWFGQGQDTGDKGAQKAYTNALKNCLLKTFLIATGEDDEQRVVMPEDVRTITAKDYNRIRELIEAGKVDEDAFIEHINRKFVSKPIAALSDIPHSKAQAVIGALEERNRKAASAKRGG